MEPETAVRKIRTYNYPDRRVTDHRVGLTVYQLESVLEGEIEEFVDALLAAEEARRGVVT